MFRYISPVLVFLRRQQIAKKLGNITQTLKGTHSQPGIRYLKSTAKTILQPKTVGLPSENRLKLIHDIKTVSKMGKINSRRRSYLGINREAG